MSKIPLSILSLKSYLISLSSHYKLFSDKPLTVQHKSEYPIYKKAIDEVIARIENNFCNYDNDGWISVDDDLPKPEQEINFLDNSFEPKNFYLVQLKNGLIDTVYYATICDDCEYSDIFISCTVNVKENRYCVQERGFNDYRINEVKYWQPLPQLPKE